MKRFLMITCIVVIPLFIIVVNIYNCFSKYVGPSNIFEGKVVNNIYYLKLVNGGFERVTTQDWFLYYLLTILTIFLGVLFFLCVSYLLISFLYRILKIVFNNGQQNTLLNKKKFPFN